MHKESERRSPDVPAAREEDRATELPVSPLGDIRDELAEPGEINGSGAGVSPTTNGAGDEHPDADPEEPDATVAPLESDATLPIGGEPSDALKGGKPEIYWRYRESLFEIASNPQGNTDAKQLNRMIALSRKILEADDEHLYFQSHLVLRTMQSPAKVDLAPVIDEIEYAATSSSPINTLMRGMSYSVFGCLLAFVLAIGSIIYLEKERGTDLGGTPGTAVTADAAATTPASAEPATTSGSPVPEASAETPGELTKAVSAVPSNQKVRSSLGEALKKSMIVAGFFGVLGSVVSIMQRLDQFERPKRRSHSLVLFTGIALPLIGGVFAMVIAAVFRTGIVSTALTEPQPGTDFPYFYVVIGFLSGFSERFAGNILGRAEDGISGDREVTIRKEADGSVQASEKTSVTTAPATS